MNENRAIQRSNRNVPAASIMTPTGPAIIQVIDMPGGGALGPVIPGIGGGATSPGIKILNGILRRWWLVLLVAVVFGGSVYVGTQRFMAPVYEASATLRYPVINTDTGVDPTSVIHSAVTLLTSKEITLRAVEKEELRQALPWLKPLNLPHRDTKNPADRAKQRDVILKLKGMVDGDDNRQDGLITITTEKADPVLAAALVNAYAESLCEYVNDALTTQDKSQIKTLQDKIDEMLLKLRILNDKRTQLAIITGIETKGPERDAIVKLMSDLENKRAEALIKRMTAQSAQAKWKGAVQDEKQLAADKQKQRLELIEAERAKDQLLQSKMKEQIDADTAVAAARTSGMTEAHPDFIKAKDRLDRAIKAVEDRDVQIRTIIEGKITRQQSLDDQIAVEKLESEIREAEAFLQHYKEERAKLDQKLFELAKVQVEMQAIDTDIKMVTDDYNENRKLLQTLMGKQSPGFSTQLTIVEPAFAPAEPSQDKRQKVQLAGCGVGLLLGIILAVLVDFFDKRLRHPKDIEPLLNSPVLGMIPRIQELKKVKGEQARNLIAEEFRVIRTQLLFGNPELQNKTICVTSPTPGDGKTSLAVNLAISIAKAGRRTLLIDADLRKPDVHRIFNIPDSPGLSELIHGTCEPGAAIRKSDIELLDVLPAGTPLVRPSELVSRPEMAQLLAALSELYDHIIFDSAPLLPVSDTHVLAGMVDGVICSFNAEVDRKTVKMVEEILTRCRANLIGTVMNQVRYKQSNSYQRGKTSYDSYYSSPRGGGASLSKKADPNIASIDKTGEEAA